MILRSEIIILIVGIVLGSVLTFVATQYDKRLERKREQKKAIMCLKIELRRLKPTIDAFVRMQSTLGNSIPSSDIPELDMATLPAQFMCFEEDLAEKIYALSTWLRSANRHRQVASNLLSNPSDATFQANAQLFIHELKSTQQLLNDINTAIHFEQDASADADRPRR